MVTKCFITVRDSLSFFENELDCHNKCCVCVYFVSGEGSSCSASNSKETQTGNVKTIL